MKYLILIAFIYFAYRYFSANKALDQGRRQDERNRPKNDDFTDYEELK
ncbi:MAG TPA: hypothetical protein PLU49_11360 [Saprospiraceae bacterium]|nr:hypothetical protein [Saprospiraceae bacterium]